MKNLRFYLLKYSETQHIMRFIFAIYFFLILVSCTHHSDNLFKSHYNHIFSQTGKKKPFSSVNRVIRDLSFFPVNGSRFRLSELEDVKAIVIVMREKDCPISEKYGPRLARLEQKYSGKGIFFIYNYVGQVKKKESAKNDLKNFGFKGPYVIDSRQTVVDVLNAETTGDVFILTPQKKIIYRGPVDDQFHLLKSAIKPRNNYVSDILESVVSGKIIEPKEMPAPGCIISRPIIKEKVFWNDVAPIIQKKCTVCHNPSGNGPINYLNYKDVAGRRAMFKYVIENDLMPPWFVDPNTGPWENDLSLTSKEKNMLLKWVTDGTPKRSKKTQILWTEEKKLNAASDYVIHLPEKITIPAEGVSDYRRFVIQTDFKEDKWIKSVKFRLKPKVVHHALFIIMDPSFKRKKVSFEDKLESTPLTIVTPGANLNKNTGYWLPAGAKLILEVHYEPIGQKIIDDFTQVQINFHRKKPKYKMTVSYFSNRKINIPPYEPNYQIYSLHKMPATRLLVNIGIHMHLRGKAAAVSVMNPLEKGKRKSVLTIDPYTRVIFNLYKLKQPITISKDSSIECIFWFDNSDKNQSNPNPTKYVNYGASTDEKEMAQCIFMWMVPTEHTKQ